MGITSEINVFKWPGPDLRLTPAGRYEYGFLPPGGIRRREREDPQPTASLGAAHGVAWQGVRILSWPQVAHFQVASRGGMTKKSDLQ